MMMALRMVMMMMMIFMVSFIDVDECMYHSDNCDETCHNTLGGYRCSCQEGFMLAADQKTCNGKIINPSWNK